MEPIGDVKRNSTSSEFEWTISNFFALSREEDTEYLSSSFSFSGSSWCLRIIPDGTVKRNSLGYIGVLLLRKSSGLPISIEVSLGFKALCGVNAKEGHFTICYKKEGNGYGFVKFIRRAELLERASELVPSGVLTVFCTMKFSESTEGGTATANCSHCKEILNVEELSSHENKCMDRPIKCPECSDVIALKNWYEHECKTEIADGVATAKCSYCKEIVNAENLPSHENKCMKKPIKCPQCSVIIALKNWYEHECSASATEAQPTGKMNKTKKRRNQRRRKLRKEEKNSLKCEKENLK